MTPVPSATPLYCADVRLTLREWLDALIGRDVLSEKSVETEATRLLPSQPRASRRIGTSSEALCAGPQANRRIDNPSTALRGGASSERALARQRVGLSPEAYARGLGRIRKLAETLWLSFGFDICKV